MVVTKNERKNDKNGDFATIGAIQSTDSLMCSAFGYVNI